MTAQAFAALLLALAALLGPGRAVIHARLTAITAEPRGPDPRSDEWATAIGERQSATARSGRGSWSDRARPALVALVATTVLAVAAGPVVGLLLGLPLGLAGWFGARRVVRRLPGRWLRRPEAVDELRLAGCWDLLAACLRGGLSVPHAVLAIVPEVPGVAGQALARTADLLLLGADPVEAWAPALTHPQTERLARSSRRSARSGAALAGVAEALATEARSGAQDLAEARAQRAAVAVTGPLGLCFLPAFCCLGVLPVVIGLATRLLASW
ncbi:MAG TPA: type II secretion system F family protein [Pseudonocardiaceae bacterium]|nr:type II secretion system F family protein [Pseudonocardiaceae bacterium]